jgi:WhiB family redox-sensing transcriptional regulator
MSDLDSLHHSIVDIFQSSWRSYANCIDEDWQLFSNPENVEEGKKVCSGCSVRVECLDNALNYNDGFLRGGLTEQERNSVELHRKRHQAAFRHDISQ